MDFSSVQDCQLIGSLDVTALRPEVSGSRTNGGIVEVKDGRKG
jgi:hypothetical protein